MTLDKKLDDILFEIAQEAWEEGAGRRENNYRGGFWFGVWDTCQKIRRLMEAPQK